MNRQKLYLSMEKNIVYFDKDVVVINDVKQQMLENYSLADYLLLLFVKEGEVQINFEGNTLVASSKKLMICLPQQRLFKCQCTPGFNAMAVYMRNDLIKNTLPNKVRVINDFFHLYKSPVLDITDQAIETLMKYVAILDDIAKQPQKGYQREITRSLFSAILYECLSLIDSDTKGDETRYVRQGERLFKEFMQMLATDKIKARSVAEYAERLYITPKYLSSVSKQLTGKTASVWINQAIIKEAKHMLKYSDRSVKEIAMLMNFPNVSFFGKYFKGHVGMSPMEYRKGGV